MERRCFINGKEKPFTWAVETLRKFFVKGNADSKEKIFVQRESAKDNIKKIRISDCSYDLDEYYRRFDTSVVAALNIGCDLPEYYLITLFVEGCSEHRALAERTQLIHLESNNYTDLKALYADLISKKSGKKANDSARSHYSSNNKTRRPRSKLKCYNCGEHGHAV